MRRSPALLAPLLGLALAGPLHAQTVRGAVVDSAGGGALPGVLLTLVDGAGKQRARTLSDAAGAYALQAPEPGTFRLRAERVGHRATLSAPLALGAGETRELRMAVPTAAISLAGVVVEGRGRRCAVRPEEGAQTATLWDEARKALDAADWAREKQVFRYRASQYTRDLDAASLQVRGEQRRSASATGRHPFASLPGESLSREGYVRATGEGTFYYAPDAAVLLSDAFLETHCFRVQEGGREQPGLVGLAFEPVAGRRTPDVQGVLWLDRASAELRHLEYRYTQLDLPFSTERLGGRVEFERVPTGAWIVRRWWIRMPALQQDQETRNAHEGSAMEQRTRTLLAGLREEGGEVEEVLAADGSPLVATRRAALAGTVFDSTRAGPVAGATVFVSGTQYSATTDAAGRFRIDGVPEGEYSVAFHHPRLDTLGVTAPPRQVSVGTGGEATVEMAVPSVRLAAARPAPAGARDGSVSRARTGDQPIRLAGLRATAHARAIDGFRRRAARGDGIFITREQIERQKPTATAELFRTVSALEVDGGTIRLRMAPTPVGGLAGIPAARDPSGAPGATRPGTTTPAGGVSGAGGDPVPQTLSSPDGWRSRPTNCVPLIYLDEVQLEIMDGNLSGVHPADIEGIEIYPRSALAPQQYRRPGNSCGVVLIWSRLPGGSPSTGS